MEAKLRKKTSLYGKLIEQNKKYFEKYTIICSVVIVIIIILIIIMAIRQERHKPAKPFGH